VIATLAVLGWLAVADAGPEAPAPVVPAPAPPAAVLPPPAVAPPAEVPSRGRAKAEHAQALAALRAGRVEDAAALFGQAVAHEPASAPYATRGRRSCPCRECPECSVG